MFHSPFGEVMGLWKRTKFPHVIYSLILQEKFFPFSKLHNFLKWGVKHFATSLKIWFQSSSFQWYYFQFEIRWRSLPNSTLKMSSCPISPMYSILEFSPHWGKHALFSKTEIAIRCRIVSATKLGFHLIFFFVNANPIPSFPCFHAIVSQHSVRVQCTTLCCVYITNRTAKVKAMNYR